MDKLAAINEILMRCGLGTVASLDTGNRSDAALAEIVLDEVDLRIQGKGWSYNIRENVELEYDGSGYIMVPSGTIWIRSGGQDAWRDVAQVGGKLYDRDNNTDVFTSNLYCDYCLRYDIECIPFEVRQYIVVAAAEEYLTRYGDRLMGPRAAFAKLQLIQKSLRSARTDAKRFEAETGSHNVLSTVEHKTAIGWRQRIPGWNVQ